MADPKKPDQPDPEKPKRRVVAQKGRLGSSAGSDLPPAAARLAEGTPPNSILEWPADPYADNSPLPRYQGEGDAAEELFTPEEQAQPLSELGGAALSKGGPAEPEGKGDDKAKGDEAAKEGE